MEAALRSAQLTFPVAELEHPYAAGQVPGTRGLFLGDERVLTQGRDGQLHCWKLTDPSTPAWSLASGDSVTCGLGVHPRSEAFVLSMTPLDGDVRAFDAETRSPRRLPGIEPGAEVRTIVFDRDGGRVFLAAPYAGIYVHRWPSLERERFLELEQVRDLSVSPDGRLLAAAGGHWKRAGLGFVRVWQVSDGALLFERKDDVARTAIAFHPSGERLAVGTVGGAVYSFRLDEPETIKRYAQEGGARDEVSFSSGGAHSGPVVAIRYDRQGELLYSVGKAAGKGLSSELRVWTTITRELAREVASTQRSWISFDLSPDGRLLALGSEQGPVEVHLAGR